jgi:hypothetical protein
MIRLASLAILDLLREYSICMKCDSFPDSSFLEWPLALASFFIPILLFFSEQDGGSFVLPTENIREVS